MIDIKQHFCYLRPMRISVFTLVALLLWGCSKVPESFEPVEPLQNVQFEFLQFANKLYFSALVQPTYLNNSIDSELVLWYGPDSLANPDTIRLYDDGSEVDLCPDFTDFLCISGDYSKSNNIFSRKIPNTNLDLVNFIPNSSEGPVYLNVIAYYLSDVITISESDTIGSFPSEILFISFPDSMIRPPLQDYYNSDTMRVFTDDENGFDDIQACYMYLLRPDSIYASDGRPIYLYDDGGIENDSFLWDKMANDGIYTRLITIGNENPLGTYTATFHLNAYDSNGDTTVIKYLEVIE